MDAVGFDRNAVFTSQVPHRFAHRFGDLSSLHWHDEEGDAPVGGSGFDSFPKLLGLPFVGNLDGGDWVIGRHLVRRGERRRYQDRPQKCSEFPHGRF